MEGCKHTHTGTVSWCCKAEFGRHDLGRKLHSCHLGATDEAIKKRRSEALTTKSNGHTSTKLRRSHLADGCKVKLRSKRIDRLN